MTTKNKETAAQAYSRNHAEALKRLDEIRVAILSGPFASGNPDWGHVGSLAEVVKNLGQAGHHAGVERLTEK